MAGKSNYTKMISGMPYHAVDAELFALQATAARKVAAYNSIASDDHEARDAALRDLFGRVAGWALVQPPIYVDFGIHIHLEDTCFINTGAVFLDSADITFGKRVFVGPRVQFLTATHPVKPEERCFGTPEGPLLNFGVTNIAEPITVGDDCWIGAGAIILPGVAIGAGTTVGAGAVVTKSLPERVVAFGNPAKIVRSVDE
ncbi:MAG: sugar O-acetyltransferase [Silicimonas sp.]|nr:sugar O-acetyltransferase [Silicimonas sp.]NND43128.1 sugar O-acetyltransferase [Silicimonas sp.]